MFVVIMNPTAGGGRGEAVCKDVCELLKQRSIPYRVENTESTGHATELAARAARTGCSAIAAIGGDGTLCEIAAGLAEKAAPLYFVPCGTGNDFIKSLKLPLDPVEALKLQLDAPISQIDVGRMNDIRFLNVSGTGLIWQSIFTGVSVLPWPAD